MESDALFGCGAGFHHLFVDAAGNVCPCDLTPLGLGNLYHETLAAIWDQMGAYFAKPRCGCLMGELGCHITDTSVLPLTVEESRELCSQISKSKELPEGYRRLY